MHNNIAAINILLFLRQKNSISKIVQLYVHSNTAILLTGYVHSSHNTENYERNLIACCTMDLRIC